MLSGFPSRREFSEAQCSNACSAGGRRSRPPRRQPQASDARCTMMFRPYYYFDRGCAAYLFGCGTHGVGAVVDARADDVGEYLTFAADKGLRLTHVIDTHIHADHRSGGPELACRAGAPSCVHESADIAIPFAPLQDEGTIDLGNTRIKVLHTPGHSPESVCL